FVAAEIAPPVIFLVALDPLDRIRLAHVPADGEREHLRQDGYTAVGGVGGAGLGDLTVEGVNVLEADIGHLGVLAEVWLDVQLQQVAVFAGGAGALLRKVLRAEALDQIEHGGGGGSSIAPSGSPPSSTSRRSSRGLSRASVVGQTEASPMV